MGKKKKRKVGIEIQADAPDLTDHILNQQSVAEELEVPEGTVPDKDGGVE